MAYRNFDMEEVSENILNLTESARLLHEEKVDRQKLVLSIEKDFNHIFSTLHVHRVEPLQKDKIFNVGIFRQCTELVASTDKDEFRALKTLQNMFFSEYTSHNWNPSLLTKLLTAYYRQLMVCFWFVARRSKDVSLMMQLASIATQTDSIKKLQSLFSREVWGMASEVSDGVRKKKKIESISFDDEAM